MTALLLLLTVACSSPPEQGQKTPKYPQRIISLVPSATEMIHAVGASDRLVGVTLNDDFPPSVAQLPKVGDQTIDLEKVMSLEPDLVVLDSAFKQNKQSLQELDIQVLELQCERLQDVPQSLRSPRSRARRGRGFRKRSRRHPSPRRRTKDLYRGLGKPPHDRRFRHPGQRYDLRPWTQELLRRPKRLFPGGPRGCLVAKTGYRSLSSPRSRRCREFQSLSNAQGDGTITAICSYRRGSFLPSRTSPHRRPERAQKAT